MENAIPLAFRTWSHAPRIGLGIRTLAAALFVLALGSNAVAGLGQWTRVGPPGGIGYSIAVDPTDASTVYATIDQTVYKSTDGGASWVAAGSGLPISGAWSALAIDPFAPTHIYGAAQNHGIYVSLDAGGSWAPANTGLPPGHDTVAALAFDPTTAGTIYVTVGVNGVYKSTNGGASWSPSATGLSGGYTRAIAVDPATPTTIYVGAIEQHSTPAALFKSVDGGASWNPTALSGAAFGTNQMTVSQIVIDPLAPATLYVVVSRVGFLDFGPYIAKSTDGGASFTRVGPAGPVNVMAIDPANPARLLAGTADGVFTSLDAGATWSRTSAGLTAAFPRNIAALAIASSDPLIAYAAPTDLLYAGAGIFATTDGGAHWTASNLGLPQYEMRATHDVALAPDDPTRVYAMTSHGVVVSPDAGAHWTAQNLGLPSTADAPLTFDPVTPTTVYAALGAYGVFKSVDRGALWTDAGSGLGSIITEQVVVDPMTPATLYVATSNGVFRSSNAGGSWSSASAGLPALPVQTLAIDPGTPTTLYAGTSGGVYKSINAGTTWTPTPITLANGPTIIDRRVTMLVVDATAPQTVYAATFVESFVSPVFLTFAVDFEKSTDGGTSWTNIQNGINDFNPVYALAFDPTVSTTLYAGTAAGVYQSLDAGGSWAVYTQLENGNVAVDALAIDPLRPSWIYAATGVGLYRIEGPCAVDADCTDGNPCTTDTCNVGDGSCANAAVADATACDDDDACSAASQCAAGVCAPVGALPTCDDGDQCTDDVCSPPSGTCVTTLRPSGGLCDDGSTCTHDDQCNAGTCAGSAVACDACLQCEEGLGCVAEPRAGCVGPRARGSSLSLKESPSSFGGDQLKWRWKSGSAMTKADFGTALSFALCLYDTAGGTPRLLSVPSTTAACPIGNCWTATGRGYKFLGTLRLALSADTHGKGQISITAKSLDLSPFGQPPALPMSVDPKVVMQLQRTDAPGCWESEYATSKKNTPTHFDAKTP